MYIQPSVAHVQPAKTRLAPFGRVRSMCCAARTRHRRGDPGWVAGGGDNVWRAYAAVSGGVAGPAAKLAGVTKIARCYVRSSTDCVAKLGAPVSTAESSHKGTLGAALLSHSMRLTEREASARTHLGGGCRETARSLRRQEGARDSRCSPWRLECRTCPDLARPVAGDA